MMAEPSAGADGAPLALEIRGVSKRFPGVHALDRVDLDAGSRRWAAPTPPRDLTPGRLESRPPACHANSNRSACGERAGTGPARACCRGRPGGDALSRGKLGGASQQPPPRRLGCGPVCSVSSRWRQLSVGRCRASRSRSPARGRPGAAAPSWSPIRSSPGRRWSGRARSASKSKTGTSRQPPS